MNWHWQAANKTGNTIAGGAQTTSVNYNPHKLTQSVGLKDRDKHLMFSMVVFKSLFNLRFIKILFSGKVCNIQFDMVKLLMG